MIWRSWNLVKAYSFKKDTQFIFCSEKKITMISSDRNWAGIFGKGGEERTNILVKFCVLANLPFKVFNRNRI